MTNHINIKTLKKNKLIELLMKSPDKRRRHCLYLASCYFTRDSAKALINNMKELINLTEVKIYIDRKTACCIGKADLTKFYKSFNDIKVNIYAVETEYLFHTKAYAIISTDNDDSIVCGSLVIGSANLTGSGLTSKYGNIESLLDTQDNTYLIHFIEEILNLKLLAVENIEQFKNADDFSFKFALLQEGCFVHKWSDNLGAYLSTRYQLNEKGKEKIGDESFKNAGFNIETATISKRYFKFDYEPPHLENADNLKRNYGIETFLGHWIPNAALETLFEQNAFDEFKNNLKNEVELQAENISISIARDLEYLKSEDVIHVTDSNPIELFEKKVAELFENEFKLQRIFSKYEIFNLPYDTSQKTDIEELFEEMVSLSESRTKKNIAMKAFLNALTKPSLDDFRDLINENI